MITIRQIERLWLARDYEGLFRLLLANRAEASLRLEMELGRALPAAAMVLIRLDELGQAGAPIAQRLLRVILASQETDGGWADPMTTALCLRALACSGGQGLAIERGLRYLANLQKTEGIWPKIPMRRMPADSFVSAFVLFQLGVDARFRHSVRAEDAVRWFETHPWELDVETQRLWESCRAKGLKSGSAGRRMVAAWS